MVELPDTQQPTVEAIYASYEAAAESGYRDHLGASLIGASCERAIWYSWRWTTRAQHTGRLLRLFETGQMAEARFVANLRAIGVEVHEVDPDTGKQFVVRDESGHFGGSLDGACVGLIEAPKTWHVVEMKTHSAKSFAALKAKGVKDSKPAHHAQMQTYMHFTGMTRAFYLAVNKDTDELYQERIEYDAEFATRIVAKAHRIIGSPQPPERISADPSWFECKFCDHRETCHGERIPEAHCRSCLHSTPVEGGQWNCELHNRILSSEEQRKGCYLHLYIPGLIPYEQIDVKQHSDGSGCITYRKPDGSLYCDGIPF